MTHDFIKSPSQVKEQPEPKWLWSLWKNPLASEHLTKKAFHILFAPNISFLLVSVMWLNPHLDTDGLFCGFQTFIFITCNNKQV